MISRVVAICVLVLLAASAGSAEWPTWIDEHNIRGAYDYSSADDEDLAKMAAHGVNTLLVYYGFDVDKPEAIAALDQQADWCADLGLHLFPSIHLCGDDRELRYLVPGGRCYVAGDGTALTRTPCPIDPDFWYMAVTRRAEMIARHSLHHQIDGFILDPEMYGADDANFPGYCYCEYCFREFLGHRGLSVEEPAPAERVSWLQQQELQESYESWKKEQAEALARSTEQAVHAINPDLIMGGLMLDGRTWYEDAWARGFGTAQMPVIAFSENTYGTGATAYLGRVVPYFEQIGAHALLCPGLWIHQFPPEDIAAQLFYMAQDSIGYWVFTTLSLRCPPEEIGSHYGLPEPHDPYWNALRLASDELNRQEWEGKEFVPTLQLVHRQDAPGEALAAVGLLGPAQVELCPLVPEGHVAGRTGEPSLLRGQAVYYVLASAGQNITGRLRSSPAGDLPQVPVYGLIAPGGEILAEGLLPLGEVVSLNLVAPETGLYKLALTGRHLFSVALNMPHVVLSITEEVTVYGPDPPRMYFYVPAEVEQFRLEVGTPYVGEQARLLVWAPSGGEAANVQTFERVPGQAKLYPSPEQRGKVWSLQILPADHGAFYRGNLTWDPQLPPYLADSPQALLLPAGEDD